MSGRTEVEAVQRFQESVQRIVSCVTTGVVSVGGGYYVSEDPHLLTLGSNEPVRLGGEGRFSLSIIQHYRIIQGMLPGENWQVLIVGITTHSLILSAQKSSPTTGIRGSVAMQPGRIFTLNPARKLDEVMLPTLIWLPAGFRWPMSCIWQLPNCG